jgi:hypothetical protein
MRWSVLTNSFNCDSIWAILGQASFRPVSGKLQGKRQLACKPGSVHKTNGKPLISLDNHSSGTLVAKRFTQPTRMAGRNP